MNPKEIRTRVKKIEDKLSPRDVFLAWLHTLKQPSLECFMSETVKAPFEQSPWGKIAHRWKSKLPATARLDARTANERSALVADLERPWDHVSILWLLTFQANDAVTHQCKDIHLELMCLGTEIRSHLDDSKTEPLRFLNYAGLPDPNAYEVTSDELAKKFRAWQEALQTTQKTFTVLSEFTKEIQKRFFNGHPVLFSDVSRSLGIVQEHLQAEITYYHGAVASHDMHSAFWNHGEQQKALIEVLPDTVGFQIEKVPDLSNETHEKVRCLVRAVEDFYAIVKRRRQ